MKLLVDGRCLEHRQVTGVQRYTRSLVQAMRDEGYTFDVAVPSSSNRWAQQIWEHTTLPREAASADALFCPANVAPLILSRKVKLIATLHSLAFLHVPKSYRPCFRGYYKFLVPRVIRRADAVITVSDAQVREIEETYREARGKTFATYLGVTDEFYPDANARSDGRPALLFVGSLAPAKNLPVLIDAFTSLVNEIPHELWIIGAASTAMNSVQSESSSRSGVEGRIRYLGQIFDDAELARYYQQADLFIFPSLYESFGLPPLEAMACGTPVLVSDLPCHREVVGDAGVFFDPRDVDELRAAILSLVQDGSRREELSMAGRERAGRFSWQRCARESWDIFERTVVG